MKRLLASILLAGFVLPAFAAPSAEEIKEFLDSNKYWKDEKLYGENSVLYRALAATSGNASAEVRLVAAASTLAKKWRISEPVARKLIEAIVEADTRRYGEDSQANLKRVNAQLLAALRAQPDSAEAWGLAVRFWEENGSCGDVRLRDEYLSKPFAAERYLNLLSCENWRPAFARLNPGKPVARLALAAWIEDRDSAAALAAARWAIDVLPHSGQPPSELQLYAVRKYWRLLGKSGLSSSLLAEAAGSADLDALLHRPSSGEVRVDGYQFSEGDEVRNMVGSTRRQWLLALISAGRLDETRAELHAHPDKADDGYLGDAVAGKTTADIYTRYVDNGNVGRGFEQHGEMWASYGDGASGMRVAARFLAANRMESSAGLLREDACNRYQDQDPWAGIYPELKTLPREFQEYWAQYSARVAEARRAAGCPEQAGARRASASSRLTTYPEVPLDDSEKARKPLPNYQDKVPMPESFSKVRSERQGDEIRVVCLSPAVDPGGEVSPGGYWLVRSPDAGAHWQRPLYLGFQHLAPYVVLEDARVSMFAPGVLRLEVEVAEIDPASITFPPVGLSLRREAKDLRIDIPLADLEHDQDNDGLTDMLEAKIATDPNNPDTDGDGLNDSLDDFPQASARSDPDPLAPIIVDLLKRLTGYERAGIIEPVRRADKGNLEPLTGLTRADAGSMLFHIIEGDARKFAGLRANGQVIVLSAEQVAGISARSGAFYPLSFPAILVDPQRTRALVKWSAGWTGGTITYALKNGSWVGSERSHWITRLPLIGAGTAESPG